MRGVRAGRGAFFTASWVALAAALGGCGHGPGAEAARESAALQSGEIAQRFTLKFVEMGADPAFPDTEADLHATRKRDEAVISPREILFRNIVEIPAAADGKAKPLFLVWADDVLGPKILRAFYVHRVEDLGNREQGPADPQMASYDERSHRWFIAVSRLFKHGAEDADLRDLHQVLLDLHLEGDRRLQLRVRFRLQAATPKLPIKVLPPQVVPPRFGFTVATYGSGWPIRQEQLVNPTSRTLVLWIRVDNSAPLVMQNFVKILHYCREDGSGGGPYLEFFSSSYNATLRRVAVRHLGGAPDDVFVPETGRWQRVELRPEETAVVTYWADPVPGIPLCPNPEAIPFSFGRTCQAHSRGQFHRSMLTGKWGRELVLSDELLLAPELDEQLASPGSRVQKLASDPIETSLGQPVPIPAGSPVVPLGCDGSFPPNADGLG